MNARWESDLSLGEQHYMRKCEKRVNVVDLLMSFEGK